MAGFEPARLVFEFALPSVTNPAGIASAVLNLKSFGGSRGDGMLEYRIFGYTGTGTPTLTTGSGGVQLAGPFYYDIDIFTPANLSGLDVTEFVRSMATSGATYVGFSLRDTNTPANFNTDSQYVVVQNSPFWANDTPPNLTLQVVPEPSAMALTCFAFSSMLLRRKRLDLRQ